MLIGVYSIRLPVRLPARLPERLHACSKQHGAHARKHTYLHARRCDSQACPHARPHARRFCAHEQKTRGDSASTKIGAQTTWPTRLALTCGKNKPGQAFCHADARPYGPTKSRSQKGGRNSAQERVWKRRPLTVSVRRFALSFGAAKQYPKKAENRSS